MVSRTTFAIVLAAAVAASIGCKPESAQVGKDVGNVAADTATLRTASDAVNELIRNAADCDAARPLVAKATASVEEAAKQIRTSTGLATLDALRSQIRPVRESCGG